MTMKTLRPICSFLALAVLTGCLAPQTRTGENFVATKRQFRLAAEAGKVNPSLRIFAPVAILLDGVVGVTYSPLADLFCLPCDAVRRSHGQLVRVTDEDGRPVANATVDIVIADLQDRVRGATDSSGVFRTERVFADFGIESCEVSEDGCYGTFWKKGMFPWLRVLTEPRPAEGRTLELRIKRRKNPMPMAYGEVFLPKDAEHATAPLDYDCERCDWLPPYGRGRVGDLRFALTEREDDGRGMTEKVFSVTALGEGCGFCKRAYDTTCILGSDTRVPSDADFATRRLERADVFADGRYRPAQSTKFEWQDYYVMRLRVRTDEDGVEHARYGKFVAVHGLGSRVQTYLNEREDDRSLEAALGENPAAGRTRGVCGKVERP